MRLIVSFLLLLTASSVFAQDWPSVTELRYKIAKPALFAKVMEARAMLDAWRGDSKLLGQSYTLLDDVLKQDEEFAPAYLEAARMVMNGGYQSSNNYAEGVLETAEQYLTSAIALEADYSDAYVVLGHVYLQMKRLDDADEVLAKAVEIGSDSPWLKLNIAGVSLERRDYVSTLAAYQAVVDAGVVTPMTYAAALRGLVNTSARLGDINGARAAHQKLLDFEPDSPWNWGNYGAFQLYRMGDYNNAIVTLEKTRRMMDYGIARRDLACALVMRWAVETKIPSRSLSALEALERALDIYPDMKVILATLSQGQRTRPAVEPFRLWISQNFPAVLAN